jgi:hypothetical protein
MPISRIETNEGPLFWYKQSHLLLHKDRFFAVDTDNYLGELMLSKVTEKKIPLILSYPQVPFCPPRYLLRLGNVNGLFLYHSNDSSTCPVAGRSIAFYPKRNLPGNRNYVGHIAGPRDFLTPSFRLIRDWMKKIARVRIEGRKLALAMGLHPRLGVKSPLFELGVDLLLSIK